MPEEINRVVTDVLSTHLYVSEHNGVENLRAEGISGDKVRFVGNVMIDTLLRFRDRAKSSPVLDRIGLRSNEYILVTLHRPANVDEPSQLRDMVGVLRRLANKAPVVFPVHPRTELAFHRFGIDPGPLKPIPPQGYIDFVRPMSEARLVLTDSGGVQEETTILQVPCLTLRENTERPATIESGTNRLVGTRPDRILEAAIESLESPDVRESRIPDLWDGKAAERIVDGLEQAL